MNDQQLREKLTHLVNQYDDPEGIFKGSVDEFMHMYGLRDNYSELVDYMLSIEYAPDREEAPDIVKKLDTAESVISMMECDLYLLENMGKITAKEQLE